jgi:uncharacterized protein YegP (UPF0339 family)
MASTPLPDAPSHFEKYVDRANEWRWTLVAKNGKKIADSGEGYTDERGCDHGINLVKAAGANTPVRKR